MYASKLTPRERFVLSTHMVMGVTLKNLGTVMGLSPARIHQIEKRALGKVGPDRIRFIADVVEGLL